MFNWCEPFAHEWMFEKPFIKGHGDKFIWIFYFNSFNNALECVFKIFQPISIIHHVEKFTEFWNFDVIDMWRLWMPKLSAQQGLLFEWDFHHNHHNHAGPSQQHIPSLWCGGWTWHQCYWQAWDHSERGLWLLWNTNLLRYSLFSVLVLSNISAYWEKSIGFKYMYILQKIQF